MKFYWFRGDIMNNTHFLKTAFFALTAIACISIVSMFLMQNSTGAYFWSSTQPSLGYCRCIIGPYISGIEYTPYSGPNMEFKGFTTYAQCIDICDGMHSWRAK